MPIYEYDCSYCGNHIEKFFKVNRVPRKVRCKCGRMARRVLSVHGAVQTDGNVKWLDSAKMNLANDAKHITTRGEWKRYLKAHNLECVG